MKAKIRTPYFEIGIKNFIYGDEVLKFAKFADTVSKKYDIDIMIIVPYTEIRSVSENTKNLVVMAPYMDILYPGRGMADVLPEAVKAAGAKGVVVNHCEKPMSLTQIKKTIDRANELDLLTFACADTIAETKAIANLGPDIINPEPTELIGSGTTSDMAYVEQVTKAVKEINPDIIVEQAAGVSTGQQVYDFIYAGAEATGAASGIFLSKDPYVITDEMVFNVWKAYDDRLRHNK